MPAIAPRPVSVIRRRSAGLARSVLGCSVLGCSVLAHSALACSAPACPVLACSLAVPCCVIVPGAAAGSRSAVPAGQSWLRPDPDHGSAGPQRGPEPDTSIRPWDREPAVAGGVEERSAPGRCRGQDASGRGWDTLCSLPGAAVPMTASLATVPRRGARSGRLTRPDGRLDRRSASADSPLVTRLTASFAVRQVIHRASVRRSTGRIDALPQIFLPQ